MTNQIEFGQPAIDGYTCPNCLQWVSGGVAHICPSLQIFDFRYEAATANEIRIANALERIAAALEKLVEQRE